MHGFLIVVIKIKVIVQECTITIAKNCKVSVFSNNTSPASNAPFQLLTNGVAAVAPPSPRPLTTGLQSLALVGDDAAARAHDAAHQRLLERNAQELQRLVDSGEIKRLLGE